MFIKRTSIGKNLFVQMRHTDYAGYCVEMRQWVPEAQRVIPWGFWADGSQAVMYTYARTREDAEEVFREYLENPHHGDVKRLR